MNESLEYAKQMQSSKQINEVPIGEGKGQILAFKNRFVQAGALQFNIKARSGTAFSAKSPKFVTF